MAQLKEDMLVVPADKKTATINAASPPLVDAFKNMLRFYYRYEISTQKMPVCRGDVQSFPAYDHGADLEKFKVTGPWLKSGFTKIKENNRTTAASERGREVRQLIFLHYVQSAIHITQSIFYI